MKKTYVGIDVSKDDFVVAYRSEDQTISTKVYENNKKGIRSFLRTINETCMMAKVCNKACKETFDRLVKRGKPKKLALIAVMNKLIKQAFAIVKSGNMYSESHQTKLIEKFS